MNTILNTFSSNIDHLTLIDDDNLCLCFSKSHHMPNKWKNNYTFYNKVHGALLPVFKLKIYTSERKPQSTSSPSINNPHKTHFLLRSSLTDK